MIYRIANENIKYETNSEIIKKKFEEYSYIGGINDCNKEITIGLSGLADFIAKHKNLSAEQSELIFSLQILFGELLLRNKLLIHASVLVTENKGIILAGKPGCGKSFISRQFDVCGETSFILSDDRTIIGLENGDLLAWNTPWSKSGINIKQGIPINAFCYIEESDLFDVKIITLEECVMRLIDNYPKEYQNVVLGLLRILLLEEKCYLIKNDKRLFDKKVMEQVIYDL